MKTNLNIILSFLLLFLLTACGTTKEGEGEPIGDGENHSVHVIQNPTSLADFLVRLPGVQVVGNRVTIRGAGSPLFVVDGVRVGRSYQAAASAVNVNDIASVEVIKSPERLTLYGREAVNGVIVIRTKRGG